MNSFFNFSEVSILAYHSISDELIDTAVSAKAFDAQLAYLRDKGFSFVSLNAVLEWLDGKVPEKTIRKAVAITFDDGYADFETTALPILEKYAAPVTLFLIGDATASREKLQNQIPLLSADAVERLRSNRLVDIGFHGMTHANLETLHTAGLTQEITSPFPAHYFAYAGGHYSTEAIEKITEVKYRAAFSIKRRLVSNKSDRYLLPRTVVTIRMPIWLVGVHTTKAINWYRDITNSVRYHGNNG